MKKEVSRVFYSSLISSIVFIVIGFLLLVFPDTTLKAISYIIGGLIAVAGILGIVRFFGYPDDSKYNKYGLAYGLVFLIISCFFFFKQEGTMKIMPFLLGIFIIIRSASKIEYAIKLKNLKNDNWKVTLIISIVVMLFGLFLVFNPFGGAKTIVRVVGAILIFYGILDIVNSYLIRCNLSDEPKDETVTISATDVVVEEKVKVKEDKKEKEEKKEDKKDKEEKKETKKTTTKKTKAKKETKDKELEKPSK